MEDNGEAALAEADVFVCENDAISLVCRVGGWPEPRLIFYKDGKRLRPNENVSLERDENGHRWILQIRNCGPRQAGKYSAVARNKWDLHQILASSPGPPQRNH